MHVYRTDALAVQEMICPSEGMRKPDRRVKRRENKSMKGRTWRNKPKNV
jgi:hypothetical protein